MYSIHRMKNLHFHWRVSLEIEIWIAHMPLALRGTPDRDMEHLIVLRRKDDAPVLHPLCTITWTFVTEVLASYPGVNQGVHGHNYQCNYEVKAQSVSQVKTR